MLEIDGMAPWLSTEHVLLECLEVETAARPQNRHQRSCFSRPTEAPRSSRIPPALPTEPGA